MIQLQRFAIGALIFVSCASTSMRAQDDIDFGTVTGNLQIDAQYYTQDSAIAATEVDEGMRMNGFLNLIYSRGNFSAGIRYEAYMKPLLGFEEQYTEGNGLTYRYASYKSGDLDVTVGNFYEQFGNGLVLRSYEERQLGIDNALDGIRLKAQVIDGIRLIGIIGKQRAFPAAGSKDIAPVGRGIVRGIDANVNFNALFPSLQEQSLRVELGGSFVSKYEDVSDPTLNLPKNIAAFAGRLNLGYSDFTLLSEYAYKINDPSSAGNNNSFNPGTALFLSASYATKGLGIIISGKRIDNMSFRSQRSATGNNLTLNYLPAITKQHVYTLPSVYPYGTQPAGEIGWQADVTYNIPRGSALGGKYGVDVAVNYSHVYQLDTTKVDGFTYNSSFPGVGDRLYYRDFNIEISKKWSTDFKTALSYVNLVYDKDQIEVKTGYGKIYSNIIIADMTYRLSASNSIHAELQHMSSTQDASAEAKGTGNWVFGLVEYAIAPSWFFSVLDQYNYGNDDTKKRLHYYNASVVFVHDANRFSLSYGRQREGLLCIGGVCKVVPAATGVTFSLSSTF